MFRNRYEQWLNAPLIDEETKEVLLRLKDKEIEDRFYNELEFGTGGLRGLIGVGSNRMNVYTVAKATQGFSDYLNETFLSPAVAIAYDSRNMSYEFAKAAALTFCANNITVHFFDTLTPTPMLSYAVRHLGCQGGIVITASHNPKEYNGYKVYDEHGGQVTDFIANSILKYVENVRDFSMVGSMTEEDALRKGLLQNISEEVVNAYCSSVKNLTIRKDLVAEHANQLNIIYTPIHGSGNIPIRRIFSELGYQNVQVVDKQAEPNGDFPTAPYPNPEMKEVFALALELAKQGAPDIILGTDPDCDRVGVVVSQGNNEYKVLTGNETGLLLAHYIVSARAEQNDLPSNGVIIKTIVTTDAIKKIAKTFGIEILEVLTGFKYIGEKIEQFGENGEKTFLFGLEESYGYLVGEFVRDKDAIIASALIAEMALYYKKQKMSLYDALTQLYEQYGYYKESLISIESKGIDGMERIGNAIEQLRRSKPKHMNKKKVVAMYDFQRGVKEVDGVKSTLTLPQSNVIKFVLEDDSSVVVRPSGTEPKMKIYFSVTGKSKDSINEKMAHLQSNVLPLLSC